MKREDITREEALKELKEYEDGLDMEYAMPFDKAILYAIKALEQKTTAKNDLGVDCISREQALVAIRNLYPGMPRVDFNGSLRKWVDKYKPYIECDDAIKVLPSVTPQEPKTERLYTWLNDMRLMIAPDETTPQDERAERLAQVDVIDVIMEWLEKNEQE